MNNANLIASYLISSMLILSSSSFAIGFGKTKDVTKSELDSASKKASEASNKLQTKTTLINNTILTTISDKDLKRWLGEIKSLIKAAEKEKKNLDKMLKRKMGSDVKTEDATTANTVLATLTTALENGSKSKDAIETEINVRTTPLMGSRFAPAKQAKFSKEFNDLLQKFTNSQINEREAWKDVEKYAAQYKKYQKPKNEDERKQFLEAEKGFTQAADAYDKYNDATAKLVPEINAYHAEGDEAIAWNRILAEYQKLGTTHKKEIKKDKEKINQIHINIINLNF